MSNIDFSPDDLPTAVPQGTANLASTQGVTPEVAAQAVKSAPAAGITASAGMFTPEDLQASAQTNTQHAVMQTSLAVAKWAATAEPAHLAVTKDDFGPLANVAKKAADFFMYVNGNPVEDLMGALHAQGASLTANVQTAFNPQAGGLDRIAGAGKAALDLLPNFLFAPVTEPIARAYAPFIDRTNPILPWEASRPLTTPEEKLNEARNLVNLAFLAQGSAKGAAELGAARPSGPVPASPLAPKLPSPAAARAAQAATDAQHMAAMQEALAATKTHGRSVDVAESYLAQQTGNATVSVDADKLIELAQGGKQPFEDHTGDIAQAGIDGGSVEVPLSKYIARTAGQPYADELNAATSFRPEGISVDEAKELGESEDRPAPTHVIAGIEPTYRIDENGKKWRVFTPEEQDTSPTKPAASATVPSDLTPEEAPRFQALAAKADQSVDQIVQAQRLRELFTDAKAIGMTEPQFAAYNAGIEEHIASVKENLLDFVHRGIVAERKPEFQARVAAHQTQIAEEINRLPVVAAMKQLQETGFKLDRDLVGNFYPEPAGRLAGSSILRAKGNHPDEAAELLGYDSGAQLVGDLANLHSAIGASGSRNLKDYIAKQSREAAHSMAAEETGFTPEAIEAEAQRWVNGPKVQDFLATELQVLAKEAGLPFDRQALQAYADSRFAGSTVAKALNLKAYIKSTHMLGVKAEKALLKGDLPLAFIRKQQQFIQQRQLAASLKFAKEHARATKLWTKVARKVSFNGVDQTAVNWSKDILATMGLEVKGNPVDLQRPIGGFNELSEYAQAMNQDGADIEYMPVPRPPNRDISLEQHLSVDQFRGVANMLREIMEKGKRDNEVERAGKRVTLDSQVDEAITSLSRYTRTITSEELANPDLLQKMDAGRRAVDAWLVRNEQLMRDFGGRDPNSPFFQVVTKRLQERKAWSNDTRLDMAKHFHATSKSVGPKFDKWMDAKIGDSTVAATIRYKDGSRVLVKNRDIFMAALHLGDQEALDAFATGFGTDARTVEAAVFAHATPDMWKAVEGIWKAFAKLRPEVSRQFRARNGVTPTLVEARPFTMPDGTVNPGGYFPIRRDMTKMPKEWVKQQELSERMLGSPLYQKSVPTNNYMKTRTGAVGPIEMSFQSVYGRINQTIHDLAYRDVLIDMNKFLLHPKVQEAITAKYGPEYVAKLRSDIRDIAGAETQSRVEAQVGKALDYMTEAQMVNMIGFSPKTMLKHGLTAQFQAISEVGALRYGASMRRFMLSPQRLIEQATTESGDVRHILSTYNEDSFQQFLNLTGKRTTFSRAVRSFAFHLVGGSNLATAVPLYDAAKLMMGEKFPSMPEADRIAAAGQLVRQALGSTGPTDAPIALRMGGKMGGLVGKFFRLTNPFLTFLSHMYNKQREIPQALGYAGEKADLGRGLAIMLASVIIPTYVEQAVTRGEWGFGKNVFEYWASGLIHNEMGGVPVGNTATAAMMKKVDPGYPGGDDTITSMFGSFGQTAADLNDTFVKRHPWTEKKTEHATIAAGYGLRAPGVATVRFEHFLWELGHTPQTAFHDLIFGQGHHK